MVSRPSYRNLKYSEYKKAVLSLFGDLSEQSKRKLLFAFEVCEELSDNKDKLYRLEQTMDVVLWEIDEAINMGFIDWKDCHLVDRSNAIIYHELNKDECNGNCLVCKTTFRWKT